VRSEVFTALNFKLRSHGKLHQEECGGLRDRYQHSYPKDGLSSYIPHNMASPSQVGCSNNTFGLYFGGIWFKSGLGNQQSWMRFLVVIQSFL